MQEQDAGPGRAQGARRLDVLACDQGSCFRVDDPCDLHPVHQRDHHGDDPQGRCEDGRKRDGQEQGRKGRHQVGEAHDGSACPALDVAGDDAEQGAHGHGGPIGDHPDQQRRAGSVQEARQEVPAQKIGAEQEPLVGRQRCAFQGQTFEELLDRIERGQHRRRDGRHGDRGDGHQAGERQRIPGESMPPTRHRIVSRFG